MPSYQYLRDIKPEDQQPEPPKEYTPQEKRRNWWHYNWKFLVAGIIAVAIIAYFIADAVTQVKPDLTIGFLSPYTVPDDLQQKMGDQIATLITDTNGDGKTVVQIDNYTVQPSLPEDEAASSVAASSATSSEAQGTLATEDPYSQMAGITRLSAALSGNDPLIYILDTEEAQNYLTQFELLGKGGTTSQLLQWKDCPPLSALDLTIEAYDGQSYDGQALMQEYYLLIRPYQETSLTGKDDGLAIWEQGNSFFQIITRQ